jgi:hypothetical protein
MVEMNRGGVKSSALRTFSAASPFPYFVTFALIDGYIVLELDMWMEHTPREHAFMMPS